MVWRGGSRADCYSVQRKETKQKAMDALNRGGMMEQGAYESERFKAAIG